MSNLLFCAVVGVKHNWDSVDWCECTNVVRRGNRAGNASLLVLVANTLAGKVGGTTLRHLQDNGRLCISCCFERGDDGGGRGNVLDELARWH